MKKTPDWIKELRKLRPCGDAYEWAKKYTTAQEAWNSCNRGEWLLWYAARVNLTPERHRQIVTAVCRIAERQLDKVPTNEHRPRLAIEAALRWTEGRTLIEEVKVAAYAAATAAAYAAAAAYATYAAAYAADAAAAAAAAYAADAAAERKIQADIVRQYLSCP